MDETLLKILDECLHLEATAHEAYTCIADNSENKETAAFFRGMADEESEHIEFWKRRESSFSLPLSKIS